MFFKKAITKDIVQDKVNKLNILLDPKHGDISHISSSNCTDIFFQGLYLNEAIEKYNDSKQNQSDLDILYKKLIEIETTVKGLRC